MSKFRSKLFSSFFAFPQTLLETMFQYHDSPELHVILEYWFVATGILNIGGY